MSSCSKNEMENLEAVVFTSLQRPVSPTKFQIKWLHSIGGTVFQAGGGEADSVFASLMVGAQMQSKLMNSFS